MKTALETAIRHGARFTSNGRAVMNQHELMAMMHEFASQAIDEAAKEASVHHEGGGIWSVDRASILKVKELLK